MSRAVVLLSGGLDSATVLALARAHGHDVFALSVRYGQRHAAELRYAAKQAQYAGVLLHRTLELGDFSALVAGTSALFSDAAHAVPKGRAPKDVHEIPATYVPARNLIMLSFAVAWAEVLEADSVWLGVNALDYSGYPDCRPAFVHAFAHAANLATKRATQDAHALRVETPLLHMTKAEIVATGTRLGVRYAETLSCYDPVMREDETDACGACDSCALRRQGFMQAGIADPTRYAP